MSLRARSARLGADGILIAGRARSGIVDRAERAGGAGHTSTILNELSDGPRATRAHCSPGRSREIRRDIGTPGAALPGRDFFDFKNSLVSGAVIDLSLDAFEKDGFVGERGSDGGILVTLLYAMRGSGYAVSVMWRLRLTLVAMALGRFPLSAKREYGTKKHTKNYTYLALPWLRSSDHLFFQCAFPRWRCLRLFDNLFLVPVSRIVSAFSLFFALTFVVEHVMIRASGSHDIQKTTSGPPARRENAEGEGTGGRGNGSKREHGKGGMSCGSETPRRWGKA